MKLRLHLLLFFATSLAYAQSDLTVQIKDREIGKYSLTNATLNAREYTFPHDIYRYQLDSMTNTLLVKLRKRGSDDKRWTNAGQIISWDLTNRQSRWSKKFNYGQKNFLFSGDKIFEQRNNRLVKLNPENGSKLWKSKSTLFRIYPDFNLGLAYNFPASGIKTLHGISLSNGQSLWNRPIPAMDWEKTDLLDASTLMISASGLHLLNLNSGTGWDIDHVTSATKTSGAKVGMALLGGLAVAAMGGMMIPGNLTDQYTHISSDILYDQDEIYFASKNKIARYSLEGILRWSHDLNEKATSKSHILRMGAKICMINTGYALRYGIPTRFGKPFIAAYDTASGNQLFLTELDRKKDFIIDFRVKGDTLYLLFPNSMEVYKIGDQLSLMKTATYENAKPLVYFATELLFLKTDTTLTQLPKDSLPRYALNEDFELLRFDDECTVSETIPKQNVYRNYLETPEFLFLSNFENSIVVSRQNGRVVATLQVQGSGMPYGNKLFFVDRKSLLEVDINPFLGTHLPTIEVP